MLMVMMVMVTLLTVLMMMLTTAIDIMVTLALKKRKQPGAHMLRCLVELLPTAENLVEDVGVELWRDRVGATQVSLSQGDWRNVAEHSYRDTYLPPTEAWGGYPLAATRSQIRLLQETTTSLTGLFA